LRSRSFVCIIVIFLFGVSAVLTNADDYDWPRWRGPNGNGSIVDDSWNIEALSGEAQILWKVGVGQGYSSVVLKDGYVYTMGSWRGEDTIYCLDAETGEEVWTFTYDEATGIPNSTPTIDGKYLYTLSREGLVLCLNIKKGKEKWRRDIPKELKDMIPGYGYAGSPLIEEDLVILNARSTGIALHKKTGKVVWVSPIPKPRYSAGYATPVLVNYDSHKYVAIFNWDGLNFVEFQTGRVLWSYEWPYYTEIVADPLIIGDKIFISSGYGVGCALLKINTDKPEVIWRNKNMSNHVSSCVQIDGYIYGIHGNIGGWLPFRCIDVSTGEVMWEQKMTMASFLVLNEKLIILEEDGTLHIVNPSPSSYQEISICTTTSKPYKYWSPPVLCNGKLFLRDYLVGEVICVDVSK